MIFSLPGSQTRDASGDRHNGHPMCRGPILNPRATVRLSQPDLGARCSASTLRRFGLRIDLHGGRHTSRQPDTIRHLIDVDAHRQALRQAHPGEDRIYRGQPCLIGLRVRNVDAAGDATDVATNDLAVAHQLHGCRVALMNPPETGLLEVAVDPEGIGIDDGDYLLTDCGVVAELREQVGYVAVDRRANYRPVEIELRLVNGGLVQGDDRLRL